MKSNDILAADKYAVFGNPIKQSKSPTIHHAFAQQTQQNISYEKILGQIGGFSASLDAFFTDPKAKGCNVTVPFKQDAANWVTELSPLAKAAGAANTIIRLDNGGFRGDTTDGQGLVVDLSDQDYQFSHSRILLIGAGGASRGVVLPLLQQGVKAIDIVNRTSSKARDMENMFKSEKITGFGFEELNEERLQYDLIVNCTSASLGGDLPQLSDDILSEATFVYDMVYQSTQTVFIEKALSLGVTKTSDGLGMLVGQAAYSFYLWRNVMPKLAPVLKMLRERL